MRNFIFTLLALILLPEYVSAQVIKGEVVDKNGIGIQGAHIVGKDSKSTTTSDIGGNFNINAKVGERLTITMLGFDAFSVKAMSGSMVIVMKESQEIELQEKLLKSHSLKTHFLSF